MKKNIFLILILISFSIYAQIPANYYDSANGLTGYALKTQLSTIITAGHIDHGYDNLYNGYVTTDTDHYYENDGTVLDMYSENPNGDDPYNYTHNNRKCGTYNSENDCYNREHIVPQSVFSENTPMVSDIHFVVPTDGYVNNRRSNYAFGEISNPTWTSDNGSKVGTNTYPGYAGTVFEPIDEFKGDIARMLFYFATRYESQVDSWSHTMFNGTEDQVFQDWFLAMILQWSAQDPVNQRELDRNQAAYNFQGNANPFIDHPEYIQLIWNPIPDDEAPTTPANLVASNVSYNSVDLSWTASTDNVGVTSYKIYKDNTFVGYSPTTNYTVTGLSPNTTYDFYVVAYDAYNNHSADSNVETITTSETPTSIIFEDFNDCTTVSNNFTTYSEQSTDNWDCFSTWGESNTGCMQMNGFQDEVLSKDWLITANQLNFDQYDNEKLSVYLIYRFGDMSLDLVYSTDYDGVSNPATFTWTAMPNITIDTSTSDNENTQIITNADISDLNQPAYVAFKYYETGAPTRWTVDNFMITGDVVSGINDSNLNNTVVLYPNPTKEFLAIKSTTKIKNVGIYNVFGQQVLNTKNTSQINLKYLDNGIYICKIQDEFGNIAIKKIIKE